MGWIKRGPTGTIATTLFDAVESGDSILQDKEKLESRTLTLTIDELLKTKGLNPVDYQGWKAIDTFETEAGKVQGKPREKVTDIKEMMSIALKHQETPDS